VAAALVRARKAQRVLVPTVKLSPENEEGLFPPEHDLIRKVLLARGVSPSAIVQLQGECESTWDEAHALARFLEAEPTTKVAVVTHDFHTRRTRLILGKLLGDRMSQVHVVAAPHDDFDADTWWQTAEGFATYTSEYVKMGQVILQR
jgi:uncharacterized SAM-binding protein YcdF (DUF218 family)